MKHVDMFVMVPAVLSLGEFFEIKVNHTSERKAKIQILSLMVKIGLCKCDNFVSFVVLGV